MLCSVSLFKFLYESALEQATIGADTDIGGWCLAVGGATGARLRPRTCPRGGWLDAYRVLDDGRRLELMHRTPLETCPTALCPLGVAPSTRLLAGVGSVLRLFTVGKKKFLKKAELKALFTLVLSMLCSEYTIISVNTVCLINDI